MTGLREQLLQHKDSLLRVGCKPAAPSGRCSNLFDYFVGVI